MSKLEKIKARLAALLVELSVVKTDKAVLEYDGEDLVAGMNVFVTNEDGERVAAENGEYVTEDGKTITVENGTVQSIVDPIAEVDGAEVETKEEVEVEASAEEVIVEASAEIDFEAAEETKPEVEMVEEIAAEEVVEEVVEQLEDEQTEIEKLREEVNELYKLVDSILNKIGEDRKQADERFSKLEKMSAAVSAVEEMDNAVTRTSTGDPALDKKLEKMKEMGRDWRS